MEKAVFFDIDGTLVNREKKLTKQVKKAIAILQSKGIFTAIATGRGPHTVKPLVNDLNMCSYVCFNGQYVVYSNEIISKCFLNATDLQALSKIVKTQGHDIIYLNEAGLKIEEQNYHSHESLIKAHSKNTPADYSNVYQAIIFANHEENSYLNDFNDRYVFKRWGKKALDVLPLGRSKVQGIKRIIEELSIEMKDVYAFGDGLNDIEMLQEVGTGVAMGNAHERVKRYADLVTSDVNEDGIVRGLKELGLLDGDF